MATYAPGEGKPRPGEAGRLGGAGKPKSVPKAREDQARKHDERIAQDEAHSSQIGRDEVEHASIDSFPASDPPARSGARGITID